MPLRSVMWAGVLAWLGPWAAAGEPMAPASTVYRCVGEDGVTAFGDNPSAGRQCSLVLSSGDRGAAPTPSLPRPAGTTRRSPTHTDPAAAVTAPSRPATVLSASVIDERHNQFEFRDRAVFAPFQRKWTGVGNGRITIAHFGDSHLQSGFAAEAARRRLQQVRGDGGRGMVFPYALARTYSQNDYTSAFEGRWSSSSSVESQPRIPVGVSGFVARTTETPASFSFKFKTSLGPGAKRVRVFLRTSAPGLRLIATSAGQSLSERIDQANQGTQPVVEFDFPALSETLRFDLVNLAQQGASFELHGVSIENPTPGLLYHNLGVGGAHFGALNAQTHFEEQIRHLRPDLYVLDWGTNDIAHRNALPEHLRDTVASTIRRIRQADPDSVIVLTSVQDMHHRGRHITAARTFSETMKSLAFEHGCLFYDWYRVSGGADAMPAWVRQGLASQDHVHLTALGYRLKGDLFAQALLNTIEAYDRRLARHGGVTVLRHTVATRSEPHGAEPL